MVGIRGSRDQHWSIVRAIAVAPEWPDRERFLRLVHGCAGAAGVFRPARHDLVLSREDIEPLRTVFADHMHRGAAARASGIFRFDANLNPRQVLGQRPRPVRGFSERAFRSAGSALPCSASLAHAAAGRLFVEQLEVHWGATSETPGRHSDVAFSALGQVGEFAWCAAIKVRKRTTLLIVIAAAFSSRSPRYTRRSSARK